VKLFNNKILRKEPKVSVILPNYNSSGTIVATINSVLQQTYKNWEILIIDDCSDEKTKNIISKFSKKKKIKIIYLKKNKGAAYCRNFAIKKTRSDYIAFIDSDDLWQKNKLKLQINFMQENSYFFTYTNYKTFKTGSFIKNNILVPVKFDFNSFIKNTSIATSTMIVKRSITNKVKFSNTKIFEDYYYK
jgi:teichuronic acid biosynthesis glycosyltransferase TuaG